MKYSSLATWLFVGTMSFIPITNAEVINRGNGLLYDVDQNLTWTQNADINGFMKWTVAMAWVENLEYAGFNDWRLPATIQHDDPSCTVDIRVESGLFYDTLPGCLGGEMESLTATADPFNNPLFLNVNDSRYWTSTPYRNGIDPCVEGGFCFAENDNGLRNDFYWQWSFSAVYKTTLKGGNARYAWPVRDGDVVPADSSGVLMPNLDVHYPSLDYQTKDGIINIWAHLSRYGTGPNNEMLWGLVDFGVNKTAFTGEMTGEVTENLSITFPALNLEGTTYWATFEYYGIDKETHLWRLTDYGPN